MGLLDIFNSDHPNAQPKDSDAAEKARHQANPNPPSTDHMYPGGIQQNPDAAKDIQDYFRGK